jgi:NTP pyrophosphatase (non-canonical NTP hydrolase)
MIDKEGTYWLAATRYGAEAQLRMLIEECAELTKAICKFFRAVPPGSDLFPESAEGLVDDIVEEAADVLIMIEQLPIIFPSVGDDIENAKRQKIERLADRLRAQE